jgi:hypothetical protein
MESPAYSMTEGQESDVRLIACYHFAKTGAKLKTARLRSIIRLD